MESAVRVLIISDVRLYREGLGSLVSRRPEIEQAETCGCARNALEAVRHRRPDVVLLDVGICGAQALVHALRTLTVGTKVLALGLSEDQGDIIEFAEAGIAGFVSRDASVDQLIDAIHCAVHQQFPCSGEVAAALLERLSLLASHRRARRSGARLTPRETEIVELLDDGRTNKEIARALHIEVATVKNHIHNILEKLGVHTRGEAAATVRASLSPWSSSTAASRRSQ